MQLRTATDRRFAEEQKISSDYRRTMEQELKGLHETVAKSSDLNRVEGKLDELLLRNFRH